MDIGVSTNVGWVGIAIALAGWWISSAIEEVADAYREVHRKDDIEED